MKNKKSIALLHVFMLLAIPFILYSQFLWNPLSFDDQYFFDGTIHPKYFNKIFDFSLRWLPYATFEWTRAVLGNDLIWLHLGNYFIHASNGVLLYFLLKNIFSIVLKDDETHVSSVNVSFLSALIFLLHPAAVYSVAYVSQRSMLMATFFGIAMLYFFIKSIIDNNKKYLFLAVVLYGLSVLSKEHAVMLPAIAFMAALLIGENIKSTIKKCWPYFIACFFIAIYVIIQIKSTINVYGNPYESGGSILLSRLVYLDPEFNIKLAYPLSVFTQAGLFFKYLLVWIVPSPLWMSIDMYEPFATRLIVFPQLIGAIGFIVYPVLAMYLLLKRGSLGLLGFALICPWVLFFTEFSTIRIQESFVIYRSYIWVVFLSCSVPFLLQKINARKSILLLSTIAVLMMPLSWERLVSFSHPLILWGDAARLIEGKENRPGVERVYHNRGLAYLNTKQYNNAINDFNKALEIWPKYSFVYNDRGAAYLEIQNYQQALNDFNQSIVLKPDYFRPYLGRVRVYELMGKPELAKDSYTQLCTMGVAAYCGETARLSEKSAD